jgi:copper(I)-binding protein
MFVRHIAPVSIAVVALLGGSAEASPLRVEDPWSRPTPPGAPSAVGYLTLTNTGTVPVTLVGASSPEARSVEIHTMSLAGGVMRMRSVTGGLVVGPGRTLRLAPGGYHLMLIAPKRAFQAGDAVPLTLRFAPGGALKVELRVQQRTGSPAPSARAGEGR